MFARLIAVTGLLLTASSAFAADSCQDLATSKQLPPDFKLLTRSKLGPAELVIVSNGTCTCNDTPAVQRSLGQSQPDDIFWACEAADADDTKGK